MGYQNINTGRRYARRRRGGTEAARGMVPNVRQGTASSEGAAKETVSAPTFMAAAVLLAIDAFLNKQDAASCDGKEAA